MELLSKSESNSGDEKKMFNYQLTADSISNVFLQKPLLKMDLDPSDVDAVDVDVTTGIVITILLAEHHLHRMALRSLAAF